MTISAAPLPPPRSVQLTVAVELIYHCSRPTDMLLQIEVARTPDQRIVADELRVTGSPPLASGPGHAGIGRRRWLHASGELSICYQADVAITRARRELVELASVSLPVMPLRIIEYLLPSRYAPTDEFEAFVAAEFAGLSGGALAEALATWVSGHLTYVPGSSGVSTTSVDTFASRRGVCRDYAHLLISLARAGGIPARFAAVYAPRVEPPDFHAVAELYLDDAWHMIDATGMASSADIAVIGVGRDAADVAFLTAFGQIDLRSQRVTVTGG